MSTGELVEAQPGTEPAGPTGSARARAAARTAARETVRWTGAAVRRARGRLPELALRGAELLAGLGLAALMVELARTVDVDPLDRIGQVSGLAALGLRFVLLGLAVLLVVGAACRWGSARVASAASALGCAGAAGLATGFVGAGLTVALRGTTWPLFANGGDAAALAGWAQDVLAGGAPPASYPPLAVVAMAWWSELTGGSPVQALKVFEIVGAAVFGPLAYLAWRLLLRPPWALVMVLVAAVPLMDLYKPYANLVLVVLLPVLIRLVQTVRRAATHSWARLTLLGVVHGLVVGVLFLTYSGWFVWSAPGVLVMVLVAFPWRHGAGRALVLLGATAVAFLAVGQGHLRGLLSSAGTVADRYFYFDTFTEPAYIAMWRNDTPGDLGPWPPPGELAGMGLFSALLVVALGAAVVLGRRRLDVLTLAACLAGAWVVRFFLASRMYATGTVQLYPRTTVEILYCLLALGVLALMLGWRRLVDLVATARPDGPRPGSSPTLVVGVLASALLAGLFMGSATVDRYLPRPDRSTGLLAYVAQNVQQDDGQCPAYTRPDRCAVSAAQVIQRMEAPGPP